MRKICKRFFPPRTFPSKTWEKHQLQPPSRLPELQQGLGVMDTKQPCCLLACCKGKGELLVLMSLRCRVTFVTAKSFSLPDLTGIAPNRNGLVGAGLSTCEPETEIKIPDGFNTTSTRGAAVECTCSATWGACFNQIPWDTKTQLQLKRWHRTAPQ